MKPASGQLGIAAAGLLVAAAWTGVDVPSRSLAAQTPDGAETSPGEAEPDPVDRVVAVVDDDPILASDIEQVLGLGLVPAPEAGEEEAARRQILDRLIEERLRFHEIDRFGFTEVPLAEVERAYQEIRDRFPSEEAFAQRLAELGLEPDGLRQLVARQILVLTYVEERLGSRVFVSLDDIRRYYDETLEPRLEKDNQPVPPLAEVREQIRAVIKERRLNEEINRWTEELRRQADIEDFFDTPIREIPEHLVETVDQEG